MIAHHVTNEGNVETSSTESRRIGADRLIALSAPDQNGTPRWKITGKAPRLLAYSKASGLGRILAAHGGIKSTHAEPFFTSHLAATLATMAREGHGFAWLPLSLVADDIDKGRLVRAADESSDVAVDIRIFRSAECRNRASDALWTRIADL